MGVVYLAHDTKHDQPVAIKSLPQEVIGNPKVLSRWQREARLPASLNHPNIATIHEVREEANGAGYLVPEYIPGQTLAERRAKKQLKLEEALSVALQIAEALALCLSVGLPRACSGLMKAGVPITQPGSVIGTLLV